MSGAPASPSAPAPASTAKLADVPKKQVLPALSLSAVAAGPGGAAPARPIPARAEVGGGLQEAPPSGPASTWSSPASHGVLASVGADLADLADLDLAASWGAAVEAAVAGLVR